MRKCLHSELSKWPFKKKPFPLPHLWRKSDREMLHSVIFLETESIIVRSTAFSLMVSVHQNSHQEDVVCKVICNLACRRDNFVIALCRQQ